MESTRMGIIPIKWKSGFMKMKLVAEILTGRLFYVEVEEDATVGDLKKEIAKQENLPGDRLILLLDAEERYELDKDDASLKDYGVEDSSHIYVFFHPQDTIASPASPASPSTPNDSASTDSANGPPNPGVKDEVEAEAEAYEDEPPHEDNASNETQEPSASVDQEE